MHIRGRTWGLHGALRTLKGSNVDTYTKEKTNFAALPNLRSSEVVVLSADDPYCREPKLHHPWRAAFHSRSTCCFRRVRTGRDDSLPLHHPLSCWVYLIVTHCCSRRVLSHRANRATEPWPELLSSLSLSRADPWSFYSCRFIGREPTVLSHHCSSILHTNPVLEMKSKQGNFLELNFISILLSKLKYLTLIGISLTH